MLQVKGNTADVKALAYALMCALVDEDGNKKLSKKKVTKKHFSPDISAVKVLLERYYKTYEEQVLAMSDEALEEEKKKLLQQLKKEEKSGD